jgi:tRNA A-37 threonylcarbamoyl transferase component Bud32
VTDDGGPLVEHLAGGSLWQARPECREALFGAGGLRLDDWLRAGQASAVKHGPHRTVYRVALPGLSFYVKHFRLADARAWLRELVRPSKARMEYDRIEAVRARGLPTVTPLAVGEAAGRAGPGESFLVTRALEQTETLNDFTRVTLPALAPPRRTRVRQRLAAALGELVARVHDAGIDHHDLHAGNLLIRLGDDDRPWLFLIDLHAVRLGEALDGEASLGNLVVLNRGFVLTASRTDRNRFWRAYCQARGAGGPAFHAPRPELRETARELEQRTWESNLRFWRHRDRRCLYDNRYYRRVRGGEVRGHAVADLDRGALAPLLADPDAPFRRPGVRLLKDSRSTTVAEFDLEVNGRPCPVIYKRFRVTAWGDPWLALVRRPPALRSWVAGHGLRERCLPTARPLAVWHRRRNGLNHEGYLLTEKVPDAVDLHGFLAGLRALPAAERRGRLRRVLERLASLVRELHRRRLSHRDLKAANVLVRPADLSLWLIDLVGVRRRRRLSRKRRVQDLARLHASFAHDPALTRADKLRFLRAYQQWNLSGRHRWRRWWREIEQATRRKVERNRRAGRPLA